MIALTRTMIGTKPQSLITDSPSVSFTFQRILAVIRPRYEVNRSLACQTKRLSERHANQLDYRLRVQTTTREITAGIGVLLITSAG